MPGAARGEARRVWSVVVPVKPAATGKSRLIVPGVDREEAARAIALDTLEAAASAALVAELVVVTDDPGVRAALTRRAAGGDAAERGLGAADDRTTDDREADRSIGRDRTTGEADTRTTPGSTRIASGPRVRLVADPGGGLNAAIAAGLAVATEPLRAVMLGDLPSLRPADLDDALAQARRREARALPTRAPQPLVVADGDGTGTTLLAHARAELLRFGPDSFSRHLSAGAAPLDVPVSSTLRHDVDTATHLAGARALGLGPRTARLLG